MKKKVKTTAQPGLPNVLTLFGQKWTVRYVKKLVDKKSTLLGLCEPEQHLIMVSTSQGREGMINTIFHEMCHAYIAMITSGKKSMKEDVEEDLVEKMSLAMVDLLRNNKSFWG